MVWIMGFWDWFLYIVAIEHLDQCLERPRKALGKGSEAHRNRVPGID